MSTYVMAFYIILHLQLKDPMDFVDLAVNSNVIYMNDYGFN